MVTLAVLAVLAGFGLVRWRHLWSGEDLAKQDAATRSWWLSGEALRRAFIRGMPLAVVGCWALLVAWTASMIEHRRTTTGGASAKVVLGALALLGLIGLLHVSVTLFNRPKWAVPPPYRHEPGAITFWARSLRRR